MTANVRHAVYAFGAVLLAVLVVSSFLHATLSRTSTTITFGPRGATTTYHTTRPPILP